MRGVQDSPELRRIAALPRRDAGAHAEYWAARWTDALRTRGGTWHLKPIQGAALTEIARMRAALLPIRVGGGKAIPDKEPVLLDRGWTPISEVRPGDHIFGADGRLHVVLGVYPQGMRPVYRLTFSDGSTALSDDEHLWTFRRNNGPGRGSKLHTKTLHDWRAEPLYRDTGRSKAWSLFLPMTRPLEYPKAPLPLDPYTLGALLGDGGLSQTTINFTSMDEDILMTLVLPEGVVARAVSHQNSGRATQYNLVKTRGRAGGPTPNPLRVILDRLGLRCTSRDKHIPREYLRASVQQRVALLQGLLDTDGTVRQATGVSFSSTSPQLIADVRELAEGLGASVRVDQRDNHARLRFHFPADVAPFRCARKAGAFRRGQRGPHRSLRAVEYVGEMPCTCLATSAPDRLFHLRHNVLTHNTLISLLAPRVTNAVRPLLLIPAHLREKTRLDARQARQHFRLPIMIRIESYQLVSRNPDLIEEYAPDLIIADEGHYLKNTGAACTARVGRYLRDHPECGLVVMSGTLTKRSIRDFAHLSGWALREGSPLPSMRDWNVLDEWSRAIDVNVQPQRRLAPGALSVLRSEPTESIRSAMRRRLIETPGIVATQDPPLPIELRIKSHAIDLPEELVEAYRGLRAAWQRPDGHLCADPMEVWRHARELSTGFYSIWDPAAPPDWALARKLWAQTCRNILSNNRRNLDTEKQVREAVECGHYPTARDLLDDWREIEPSFTPNPVPVWVSEQTIDWIVDWADRNGPALLWTERPAVGDMLERRGIPYYGQLGIHAPTGREIEKHDPQRQGSAALSIAANSTGRNLQHWDRNLVIDVPPNGSRWEQMLGRTHRDGQTAEVVHVDVMLGCIEDVEGFWRAVEDSEYAEDVTGQAHKLCHADLEDVEDIDAARLRAGPQWSKK